jgi:hypothetical protein
MKKGRSSQNKTRQEEAGNGKDTKKLSSIPETKKNKKRTGFGEAIRFGFLEKKKIWRKRRFGKSNEYRKKKK